MAETAPNRDPDESVFLDAVKNVYRRRWLVLTTTTLVVTAVGIYSFTTVPIYQAQARLLIEAERPNVVAFKEVIDQDPATDDFYTTQYNILQSRTLARRTLDRLKLWNQSPFGGDAASHPSLRGRIAAVVPHLAIVHRRSPAARPPDETAAESRAIDVFLSNLIVAPIRSSRLVDVKFESSNPALAAAIVNTLIANYVDESLEYRFVTSKDATDWLAARLTEQRKQVEDAEAKLQAYREQKDAISLQERSNIVVQKLTELNAAATQAKTARLQKAATYEQLKVAVDDPAALDSFPAILGNAFIQQQKAELAQLQSQYAQLGEKLGPNHPEMVKMRSAIQLRQGKLDAEISNVVDAVKTDYLAALGNEQSLTAALNTQKAEAQALNRKAIEASVLERDVQSSRQIYDSLLQRAKETGVSSELKTSSMRVVDRAEQPLEPARPRPWLNLGFALIGGLVLSCGFVSLVECFDSRMKSPADVRRYLKLSDLGMVPMLRSRKHSAGWPHVNNGVPPNFSEAVRVVRTNVLFALPHERVRSVVVTSTGPREGKSLVASNLAIAIAQAGERVLIIDGDLRKPKIHEIFNVAQEPGLSNLLVGDAKASDIVSKADVPDLWVLPAGRVPPNPAELVGSERFKVFLASLASHFDWVIVDSPPVLAVTDASLIAHATSGVVFVVNAAATSRYAAQRALERLTHGDVKIMGAVLNAVDVDRNRYYYSAYYRREYCEYYAAGRS
jgi:polysaccharide biosynthesis transport protein